MKTSIGQVQPVESREKFTFTIVSVYVLAISGQHRHAMIMGHESRNQARPSNPYRVPENLGLREVKTCSRHIPNAPSSTPHRMASPWARLAGPGPVTAPCRTPVPPVRLR